VRLTLQTFNFRLHFTVIISSLFLSAIFLSVSFSIFRKKIFVSVSEMVMDVNSTLHCCEGIGTDVPDRSTDLVQPDGFYDGNVDEGLKGRSDAASPSPRNQPPRPPQMNVGAGNHPFPKSFLDGDFEFVSSFCIML